MAARNLQRIIILIITIGLAISVVTFFLISRQSPVERELKKAIYPGSYEIQSFNKTQERYSGKWRTQDNINKVVAYYIKKEFITSGQYPILTSTKINVDGVFCCIELNESEDGTTVNLQVTRNNSPNPNFWNSIESIFTRLWYNLATTPRKPYGASFPYDGYPLQKAAVESLFAYYSAVLDGLESESEDIPGKYWSQDLQSLNPIRVYTHRANTVIVQEDKEDVESGIYIYNIYSSYSPETGDDGFIFKDLKTGFWEYERTK